MRMVFLALGGAAVAMTAVVKPSFGFGGLSCRLVM